MKNVVKVSFLFLMLLLVISCAKPNEPASIEEVLNIEHHFAVSGYARDIAVSDSYLYIAEDQAGYTIYDINTKVMISHHESFVMETDPIIFENVRAISVFEDENLLFVYDQYGSPASINGFDITDRTDPTYLFRLSGNTGSIVQVESEVSTEGGVNL